MPSQLKSNFKKGLIGTGISLLVLGVLAMVGSVINTSIKNDYIGGPGTAKIVTTPASSVIALNDKLNKPSQDLSKSSAMIQLKFKNDRIVQLFGEVGEDTSRSVVQQIGKLNKDSESKPITLIINSPGGSVVDGALIVDAINGSKAPVNTLCIQVCASMAAMIHQYGKKRYILPHGILMFHPAAGVTYGDVDRMASELAFFQQYVGSMEVNAASRIGISLDEYKKLANSQIWLSGEEAVLKNYADGLVYVSGEDADKLFIKNEASQENDKKTGTKKTTKAVKNFLVQILSAGIQFINNSDDNTVTGSLRKDFNDVPVNTGSYNNLKDVK